MTADEHLCRLNSDCSSGAWNGNIMTLIDLPWPSQRKSYSKMGNHHREGRRKKRMEKEVQHPYPDTTSLLLRTPFSTLFPWKTLLSTSVTMLKQRTLNFTCSDQLGTSNYMPQ